MATFPEKSTIKLKTSDGETLEVDVSIAKCSKIIERMLQTLVEDNESKDDFVRLENVDSEILKKVIAWAEHHKDDPPVSAEDDDDDYKEKRSDDICEWDNEFLNVDQSTLFQLMIAANYLEIQDLLDVGCKKVANMIKGKTVQEIREQFNIENDYTPEEEKSLREEICWCDQE